MKANSLLLVIVLFFFPIRLIKAQENWVLYGQSVNVGDFEGLPFRLQASVKTEIDDESASTNIGVAVYTENGVSFYKSSPPLRNTQWETHTIEGVIDTGAFRIAFGTLCRYNGKFYHDDIRIDVKTKDNQWDNIFLDDFENGNINFKQGSTSGPYGKNEKFEARIYRENTKNENNCLLISGRGVPNYGTNKIAGKYANVNEIKLYYEEYGEGHPFIVLHGNGGSIGSSSKFMPHLIDKYKVIAIDSRAQGKSTDTNAPLSYMQMASDVNVLLNHLKLDSVYVWGHSDGAIVSLILAMEYPKKIKKILAFAPNITPDSAAVYQCAIDDSKKITKESDDALTRKLNRLMIDYPNIPFSRLSEIKIPVLLMVGDRDIIKHQHTLRIFQNIPKSNLCILPGTTHSAGWEKPELFLSLMDNFFEKPFIMPDSKDWFK